jgi:hypothetical protein
LALAAVAVVALLAGCASSGAGGGPVVSATTPTPTQTSTASPSALPTAPNTSTPTSSPSAAPRYIGAITRSVEVASFRYYPPRPGTQPAISWRQAYATCQQRASVCTPGTGPIISLALVSSNVTGKMDAHGQLKPTFNKTLTYVLTWANFRCDIYDNVPNATSGPRPAKCTARTFVDAMSGRQLYSMQGATPIS